MTANKTKPNTAGATILSQGSFKDPEDDQAGKYCELDMNDQPLKNKKEIGGRDGLDPTRYGDWEKNGRCIDF